MQQSRKAAKHRFVYGSELEHSTKKQKLLHHSLLPASVPSQAHDMERCSADNQKPELTHGSPPPADAQVHNATELGPPAKQEMLSYANLPPARVRKRLTSEELDRIDADYRRRRLECFCRRYGYDYEVISKLPDELLRSRNFDAHKYMRAQSSEDRPNTSGTPELDVHPPDDSSAEDLTTETPKLNANDVLPQNKNSRGRPGSGDDVSLSGLLSTMTRESSPRFREELDEAFSSHSDQGSESLWSIDSTVQNQVCRPSDLTMESKTTNASSDQIASVPPARNKGGRPRTRMLNAPKKLKGPTRFQKNHPVKAAVNIDVWENILLFCPPDFLLKARTVSSTFRSVLKDDSPIWKIARINHFGSDAPGPPLDLSEPQYADLLTGTGCQTRDCESKKTRKTYWVFQKRLCIDCFQKAFLPVSILKLSQKRNCSV